MDLAWTNNLKPLYGNAGLYFYFANFESTYSIRKDHNNWIMGVAHSGCGYNE